jgi:hypothetical protein
MGLRGSVRLWLGLALLLALVSGVVVASATGMLDQGQSAETTDAFDPTPEPTATVPARVPPTPGGKAYSPPTPAISPQPEIDIPRAQDVQLDAGDKYVADGRDGCSWKETVRDGVSVKGRVLVVLETSCRPDVIIHYYPDTGQIDKLTRLFVPDVSETPSEPQLGTPTDPVSNSR